MSSLQVNGETLDLYEKVRSDDRFTYGLELGGCATVELDKYTVLVRRSRGIKLIGMTLVIVACC